MTSTSYNERFPASNMLTLDGPATTRWLAENNKAGPDQGFTLDLGCPKYAVAVRLENTQNGDYRDRGTKKFRLLGSNKTSDGSWQTLLEANLEDSRRVKKLLVKELPFDSPLVVRFVKFELIEFWGHGGGLQYFAVQTEDKKGAFSYIYGYSANIY